MKLLQRIMSRSLLLILILVAGIAYYYRDQLFPGPDEQVAAAPAGSTGSGAEAGAPDTEAEQSRASAEQPADRSAATQSDAGDKSAGRQADAAASRPSGEKADSGPVQGTLAEVQPPALQPENGSGVESGPEVESGSEVEPGSASNSDSSGQKTTAAASPAAKDTPASPDPVPVYREEDAEIAQAEIENLLRQARTAYWSGDTGGAESAYRRVLQADRNDPDPAGELGNMLYAQGDYTGAAGAYYQAALRLLEQGEPQRARHLARVIAGLDSTRAEQLEEKLKGRNNGEVGKAE